MTAPRSSSLRALRILSQQHHHHHNRHLHITGVHSAQPVHGSERTSLHYASRTLADLQAECQKRSLKVGGSTRAEMIETLSNHDMLQSRAFSIAMKRINGRAFSGSDKPRQFNTSRAQKAVNDSSTVDFAYMPSLTDMELDPQQQQQYFIPILSDVYKSYDPTKQPPTPSSSHWSSSSLSTGSTSSSSSSSSSIQMRPQIYTVSDMQGDISPASPLSEVVDNLAVELDPFSLTETVGKARAAEELQRERTGGVSAAAAAATGAGSGEQGVVKELWSGFLEDVLGPRQGPQQPQQPHKH